MGQRTLVTVYAFGLLSGFPTARVGAVERDLDLDRGIRLVEAGQWKRARAATTTSMTVRLQDADTKVGIAVTTYSGG